MGSGPLNLDPGIFYIEVWSKIFSYLTEHDIYLEYIILRQWWVHAKLNKTSKNFFDSTLLQL